MIVKITEGTSLDIEKAVIALAPILGNIETVKHQRGEKYVTEFTFYLGSIITEDGLSSGFQGNGPAAFVRVLKKLGFDAKLAALHVENPEITNFEFRSV